MRMNIPRKSFPMLTSKIRQDGSSEVLPMYLLELLSQSSWEQSDLGLVQETKSLTLNHWNPMGERNSVSRLNISLFVTNKHRQAHSWKAFFHQICIKSIPILWDFRKMKVYEMIRLTCPTIHTINSHSNYPNAIILQKSVL